MNYIYTFTAKLCGAARKKFDSDGWIANYCMSSVNLATLYAQQGEIESCEHLLNDTLEIIAEIEKRDYSVATRAMSAKAKTMLASCYLLTDRFTDKAKNLILSAAVDADNIISSDDSILGRNAAVEAYIGILNLYANDELIGLDDAYAVFRKLIGAAQKDTYVEGLISASLHLYCLQMAAGLVGAERYEEALGVARYGRVYAKKRYELSMLDTLDVLLMLDKTIYDVLAADVIEDMNEFEQLDELSDMALELTTLIETKLYYAAQGDITMDGEMLGGLMLIYGDYLDFLLDFFDDDSSLMHDIIEEAVEAYVDAYILSGIDVFKEKAEELKSRM